MTVETATAGAARRTTTSLAASHLLSTLERKGSTRAPSVGRRGSTSPVASSYQL